MKEVLVLVKLGFSDDIKDITYEDISNSLNNFDVMFDSIVMYKQVE